MFFCSAGFREGTRLGIEQVPQAKHDLQLAHPAPYGRRARGLHFQRVPEEDRVRALPRNDHRTLEPEPEPLT